MSLFSVHVDFLARMHCKHLVNFSVFFLPFCACIFFVSFTHIKIMRIKSPRNATWYSVVLTNFYVKIAYYGCCCWCCCLSGLFRFELIAFNRSHTTHWLTGWLVSISFLYSFQPHTRCSLTLCNCARDMATLINLIIFDKCARSDHYLKHRLNNSNDY